MSASIFDIVGLLLVGFVIGSITTGCLSLAVALINSTLKQKWKKPDSTVESDKERFNRVFGADKKGFNFFADIIAKSFVNSKQQENHGLSSAISGLSKDELDKIVASVTKSFNNPSPKKEED